VTTLDILNLQRIHRNAKFCVVEKAIDSVGYFIEPTVVLTDNPKIN